MVKIPKSFKLGPFTIKVKVYENLDYDKAGEWDYPTLEIRLYPRGRNYDYMIHVFYHELTHAVQDIVLALQGEHDEGITDQYATGFLQFEKTKKYG